MSGTPQGRRTSVPLCNLGGQCAPRCSAADCEQPGALLRERPARQGPCVSELEHAACPQRRRVRGSAAVAAVHWQCGGAHRPAAAGQHVCSLALHNPTAVPCHIWQAAQERRGEQRGAGCCRGLLTASHHCEADIKMRCVTTSLASYYWQLSPGVRSNTHTRLKCGEAEAHKYAQQTRILPGVLTFPVP
jgi:hypothetical protein